MKIAMISLYLPSGSKIGSGYQAHYMANALARRGHSVTMFSPCERPEDALYEHTVVYPGRHLRTFGFAWKLRGIDFSGYDVLHAHGDDYWLWGPGRATNVKSRSLRDDGQGDDVKCGRPDGNSQHPTPNAQRPTPIHIRTMHGSCLAEAMHVPGAIGKLRMALLGLSEIMTTFVADRTVCVSQNTRRYYPWVRDVVMNGVDTSAFYPDNSIDPYRGEKEASPTILFVGTYRNRKRGKLLMDAFQETILPKLPDARLWMVCDDAPPAPGVTVMGRVPLEELASLYRRAWVFCLPSSYEGFGVPYIEAMASGTPVVAAPNVGAREVLAEGRYGEICEPEKLGETILGLLQSPEERERMRALGLQRVRDFAWDRIIDQYEEIYARTARARRRVGVSRARVTQ